jgi:two-component system sensor histidine kinase BaeS
MSPIPVDDIIAQVVEPLGARAHAAGITINPEVQPGLVVHADADRVRQSLGALLDNAVRHTPPGGAIVIEARRSSHDIRLAVRDTGPGIAAVDLPHVSERFHQADPARDRSTGGSGLGLSIVKAIVDAHGGTVGAENDADGGPRFWFDLAAAESARLD